MDCLVEATDFLKAVSFRHLETELGSTFKMRANSLVPTEGFWAIIRTALYLAGYSRLEFKIFKSARNRAISSLPVCRQNISDIRFDILRECLGSFRGRSWTCGVFRLRFATGIGLVVLHDRQFWRNRREVAQAGSSRRL
jgi:hypothetical protein